MRSVTTIRFRKAFENLPQDIQNKARKAYKQWLSDHNYPGLHFKKIHSNDSIYSVRISLSYRAIGVLKEDTMIWFWIGSHEEYNNLINSL